MIIYIIKSIVFSAVLILAYYLFLEKERIHIFKRFYLLLGVVLTFTVPLISIKSERGAQFIQDTLPQVSRTVETTISNIQVQTTGDFDTWPFLVAYASVTLLLLFRFVRNLLGVFKLRKGASTHISDAKLIFVSPQTTPHTFLNYIFISEHDSKNRLILAHELTHCQQRHSFDILFIEFVHCVFWFNPFLFFFKKAIRLNHEFLADEVVVEESRNALGYQQLLLDKIIGTKTTSIVSAFNYSITKKRFTMMTTLKNKHRAGFRIAITTIMLSAISILSINTTYSQAPARDEYTIYKDGKWQNQKLSINPGPADGMATLMKSLQRELKYPVSAKTSGTEGDVLVMFEVDEKGKPKNYSVVKKLQADCDAEVITALQNSGIDWNPAVLDGKTYPSRFVIPVSFRLDPSQVKNSYDLSSVVARTIPQVVIVAYRPEN